MRIPLDLSSVSRAAPPLTARAAVLDDARAVAALVRECNEVDIGEAFLDEDDLVSDWQRPSVVLDEETVVVASGDELVAYGEVYRGRADVFVHPSARGRGLGTALIAFAERRILREVPNVFLCVSSFNTRARTLYLRLGYEVVGELRDYIVRGHSEWLLRKSVAPLAEFTPAAPPRTQPQSTVQGPPHRSLESDRTGSGAA